MTEVIVVTGFVLTVKLALWTPPATLTLAGIVAAAGLLLVSVTTAPEEEAAVLSVTVPCAVAPPATLLGFSVTEDTTVLVVPAKRLSSAIEL
jgi:hypothetical protein